ncbi:MAG: B12-binding domain-containing radical SAM protein, partial [Planctomycetota bacterium]|nr:B12-binding domain-containing radical SAM protein [Planctomycetota bacterium]
VFISAMIVQRDSFAACLERANRLGVPVVAGGPYPSSCYAEMPGVAHFIIGEAENVLPAFLRDWESGKPRRAYARPVREEEAEKLRAFFGADADIAVSAERPSLDASPLPRFDLVKMSAYKSLNIQTSRGCPIGCEFCDIWRRFGRRVRLRQIERVLAELEEIYRLGWRSSIFVVDDNFIGHRAQAKELLRRIAAWQKERGYPFDFCTEVTLALADDAELLSLMIEAGFDMVFIGLETPVVESLKETRKYINTSGSMAERVARIQAAGIQVTAGFIIGFDNDPDDIADRMIACIHDLGIPVAMVGILLPLPETDLHDRLTRENRLLAAAHGNNTHEFSITFVPRRPADALLADYKRILQSLYPRDLKSYFDRCRILREQWQGTRRTARPLRWFDIAAALRYLGRSLFASYAWNSMRFLAETIWRKPAFLPVAISLGIQGHHFRQITRLAFEIDACHQYYNRLAEEFRQRAQAASEHIRQGLARLQNAGNSWTAGMAQRYHAEREELSRHLGYTVEALEKHKRALLAKAEERAQRASVYCREAILPRYHALREQVEHILADLQRQISLPGHNYPTKGIDQRRDGSDSKV